MTTVPSQLEPLLSGPHAPQKAFSYPLDRWRSWTGRLEGVGPVLDAMPPALDRSVTARLVDDHLSDNVAGAFTAAMVWGHGWSGYGPYRTARVLTGTTRPTTAPVSSDVVTRLTASADVARQEGAVQGFRYLNNRPGRIAGLGPAFFTKWLHFVTARGDSDSAAAAPVLDALVIAWLATHADLTIRAHYSDDYSRYLDTLLSWGEPYHLAPAQVEERIFRLIRDDGAESRSLTPARAL